MIPKSGDRFSEKMMHKEKLHLTPIQTAGALDDMLGQVSSRTGHGPAIVIPHFGQFGPHSMPSFTPPAQVHTPSTIPSPQYPTAGGGGFNNPPGYQPGAQPGYNPPVNIPGPRVTPGQGTMPGPQFGPGQMPHGPRFGPSDFPHGPRFGPSGMQGGGMSTPQGGRMTTPQGGSGFGNSGGTFGSPVGGAQGNQQPEGAGQTGSDSSRPPQ